MSRAASSTLLIPFRRRFVELAFAKLEASDVETPAISGYWPGSKFIDKRVVYLGQAVIGSEVEGFRAGKKAYRQTVRIPILVEVQIDEPTTEDRPTLEIAEADALAIADELLELVATNVTFGRYDANQGAWVEGLVNDVIVEGMTSDAGWITNGPPGAHARIDLRYRIDVL